MGGNSGTTMTSTWGIEARNTWSDTYNGTSTVRQSLPTVLGSGSQHTDSWRTQSMSVPPPPLGAARPEMPRADTTSSTTSWRTAGSANTNSSTLTSVSSAPVSPPNAQLVFTPKPVTPAGPPESAAGHANRARGFFESAAIPPQYSSSSSAAKASGTPPVSNIPATQIASSDSHLGCQTCGKTFKTHGYLMAHVEARGHSPQTHSESYKVNAVEPPRIVTTETTSDPYLTCGTCGKTFKERRYLKGHVALLGHKVRSPSPAPLTSSTAATSTTSKAYLTCSTCGNSFNKREYLERHVEARGHKPEISTNNSHRAMPSSNIREETTSSAAGAPKRSNDNSPSYLTCGTCNRTFERKEYLDAHTTARRHAPQVQIDPHLTCIACNQSFSDRNDLFTHIEQTGHARSLDTGKAEEYRRPERSRRMDNHGAHSGGGGSYQQEKKDEPINVDAWDTCLRCHKSFGNRNALFEHLRASGHAV